jgi:L-cystine uptake protein TcyP (sodium:dicarboxylate symporter family)
MDWGSILNLAVVAAALALLARRQTRGATLSSGVLIGLLAGAVLGAALQAAYGHGSETVAGTVEWLNLVGGGYVRLLQMIVVPLVLVSILSAVTRLSDARSLGRTSAGVLGTLLVTTAASAVIGIGVARAFGLSAQGLVQGARELERGTKIQESATQLADLSVPDLLLSFLPTNPFADLAGSRPTSLIAVVIFAALLGMAALGLRRDRPEAGARAIAAIDDVQALVLRLVRMVIRLTPYGVLALMTKVVATSNPADILGLIRFVAASYLGLALILVLHGVLLALAGRNPVEHFRAVWPTLTFAFTSRSSAATIPLTVETQVERLGVSPAIANFAASFGATIGQNGCAGLYPAMLAVMIAPTAGINPADPGFLLTLVLVVTLSSFGIAGVGGGATFAAILVLSTLDLPIALAGLLISIEPLIDMGRTAVNVHGAITAGTVTSRLLGERAAETADAPPAVVPVSLSSPRAA